MESKKFNVKKDNTKDTIVKFVEFLDKKNLEYKNMQSVVVKEIKDENSK